ncbi:HNH endonuclease-domain-containing protein [Tuber indicum]|nr:HNH endonuclease-domain-containing protein [Tuber indicum]
MQPIDRSPWRNTYIYASDNRSTVLGGLWAAEGVTNANLYSMLQVFCFFTDTFDLLNSSDQLVERDGQQLQPGNYYIVTAGSITVTDEAALPRATLLPSGTRVASFIDAVRQRDRRCVITGRPARLAHLGSWDTFEATHIFPLAYEEYWNDCKYSHWITIPPANEPDGSINSVQNGVLLGRDIHSLFDSYKFTINPDDSYKIVCFAPDTLDYNIAGRHLDQTFLNNPLRPVDQVLRWHFRQAVLVNMKGAGEACFETDFPPGSDMIGEIMRGAKPAERMEFELFSRFNAMENRT